MNTANHLIPLTDAIVARGQRAWGTIKKTAAEQRELWRQVGEALLVGRKQNASNQAFGKWCKDHGFDMDPSHRSNAMWLAANWSVLASCQDATLTHPTQLRQWHREQPKEPLPADLQEVSIETKKVPTVDQKTAEKVAKLAQKWASIAQQLGTGRRPSRTRRRWSTVSPRPAHPL